MFLRPRTLEEACAALAEAPAVILSGGTDYYPALGDRAPPDRTLDISRLGSLEAITVASDHVRIGARATWSRLIRTALPPCFDALKAAAREVGSVQIQNVATPVGNVCNASPAADGVPPLLALDAEVELASAAGTRTLPLAAFLQANRRTARRPDEVATALLVPLTIPEARSVFLKLGARRYLVISIVMVAVALEADADGCVGAARVAVGSCSAVARRLPALEEALLGEPIGPGLGRVAAAEHLAPLSPIDDIRASAAYRDEAGLEIVRRAVDSCAAA